MLAGCVRSRPALNVLGPSFRTRPHILRHRQHTTWRQSSRTLSAKDHAATLIVAVLCTVGFEYWYNNSVVHRIEFRDYEITKKESISNTASIFHLAPVPSRFSIWGTEKPINFQIFKESWDKSIWNIEVKQPDISVTRPYTPLPPQIDATGEIKEGFRLLVRNQEHGEVSPWIHRKATGASLRMRGPFEEYELVPLTKRVIFLAGGTGIATALQAAHVLLEGNATKSPTAAKLWPQQEKQIHIMWANRKREDCTGGTSEAPFAPVKSLSVDTNAVVAEIENLKRKFPHQLTVDYFIDEDSKYITEDAIVNAVTRFPRPSGGTKPGSRENVVFISGSDGFISYIAGPKMWNSGRQNQGLVSGVVARALARAGSNAEVVKV